MNQPKSKGNYRQIYIETTVLIWRIHDVMTDFILGANASIFVPKQTRLVVSVFSPCMTFTDTLLQASGKDTPL